MSEGKLKDEEGLPWGMFFKHAFGNSFFVGIVGATAFNLAISDDFRMPLLVGGAFVCARMVYLGAVGLPEEGEKKT